MGTCGSASVVGKGVFNMEFGEFNTVAGIGCFSTLKTVPGSPPGCETILTRLLVGSGDWCCCGLLILLINCIRCAICPWGKIICCCITPVLPPSSTAAAFVDPPAIDAFGTRQRVITEPWVGCCCNIRDGGGLPVGHLFNTIWPMFPLPVGCFPAS